MGVVSQGGGPLKFLWIFHDSLKICLFRHYGHGDNLVCLLSLKKYETTLRIIGPCQKRRGLDMFLGRGTSGHQLQGLAAKAMALLHLEVNMGHDGIHGTNGIFTWHESLILYGKCREIYQSHGSFGCSWGTSGTNRLGRCFCSPKL